VVGGPVFIPKIYAGRNRTSFWSTLGVYRSGATGTPSALQSIPTAAMRQGDFSGSRIGVLYDILDRFTTPEGVVRRNPFPARFGMVSRAHRSSPSGSYNSWMAVRPDGLRTTGKLNTNATHG